MCLAVPGEILSVEGTDQSAQEKVSFSESLDSKLGLYTRSKTGDYVIVHVGFAISKLNTEAAEKTLHYLKEIEGFASKRS